MSAPAIRTRRHRAAGFSLVEMMIALLLGAFLMMGLVQVFAASRTAYATSEGMARVQEAGRFALDTLQHDLRMGGHFGCVGDQARLSGGAGQFSLHYATAGTEAAYGAEAWPLRFHISLQGYEANGTGAGANLALPATPAVAGVGGRGQWTPLLPGTLAARAVPGSDVAVVRFLRPETVEMLATTGTSAPTLTFDPDRFAVLAAGVDNAGLFGISNCMSVTVFTGSFGAAGNTVIASPLAAGDIGFRENYEPRQSTLHRAETIAYYVGIGASGEPALFRCRATGIVPVHGDATNTAADCGAGAEELVEGVENMQLVYGESRVANGRPTGYIQTVRTAANFGGDPATNAGARETWRRVGAIQMGLVIRSPQAVTGAESRTQPFSILGVNVTPPADRRTRASYESTVALRNRLFGN